MVCSNFWKLDKIDKIIISLIFIVVSMFSIFNCFCFAYSQPVLHELDGINVFYNSSNNTINFSSSSTANGLYFDVERAHTYRITNKGTVDIGIMLLPEVPYVGLSYAYGDYTRSFLSAGKSTEISTDDLELLYCFVNRNDSNFNILVEDITSNVGYGTVVYSLIENVGFSQLWSVFDTSIPWVLVVVLFVFGWWFFSHWVKELGKGREF